MYYIQLETQNQKVQVCAQMEVTVLYLTITVPLFIKERKWAEEGVILHFVSLLQNNWGKLWQLSESDSCNPLTPKSDWHLISPYKIVPE